MVDYGGAIKKPFTNIPSLVIGIIVGIIPIVNILNIGFGLQTAQKTLNGDKTLASWKEIADIIVKAIAGIVIAIIYYVPALIVAGIGLVSSFDKIVESFSSPSAEAFTALISSAGPFFIVVLLLALIAMFLLPMAVISFLKNGFGKAFALGTIVKKALTGKYILSWIVVIVWSIVLFIVFFILSLVPLVGAFIGAGLLSYAITVTEYSIFAEAYNEIK